MQHCIMCGSTFPRTVWRALLMHTCAPAISITAQLICPYNLGTAECCSLIDTAGTHCLRAPCGGGRGGNRHSSNWT